MLKCTGLKLNWDNIETETGFPVTAGTEVILNCNPGYDLTGTNTVTCVKGMEFKFSGEEPECGEYSTING